MRLATVFVRACVRARVRAYVRACACVGGCACANSKQYLLWCFSYEVYRD